MGAVASVIPAAVGLAREVVGLFARKPQDDNPTLRAIEQANQREEQLRHQVEEGRRLADENTREQQSRIEALLKAAERADKAAEAAERAGQAAHQRELEANRLAEEARQREFGARQLEEARQREFEARQREEHNSRQAEEARQRESKARQREEQSSREAEEARQRESEARQREEQSSRRAEEARQRESEARQREEQSSRQAEEARQRESEARQREEQSSKQAEEARQRESAARQREYQAAREAEEAREALRFGIRPIVTPTMKEVAAAKKRLGYRNDLCHFAVCGAAGSGKSSLINAFRGLSKRDARAAKVGVVETTLQTARYPDPRSEPPYARFCWYDIPGAGTLNVPDWQYFNDQGLYIFDFIVLLYDVRFTKIDVSILENCRRFQIPAFIVRSKADQHIRNMVKDELEDDDSREKELFESAKLTFVRETREDLARNLRRMQEESDTDREAPSRVDLRDQRVYIVSDGMLRRLLSTNGTAPPAWRLIDERDLVADLVNTAALRRYRADELTATGVSLRNGLNTMMNRLMR